jgi:hypothetical protein
VLPAAALLTVAGAASGDGATKVPADERDSPVDETPGVAARGPTPGAVDGAGPPAEVPPDDEAFPVDAGAVPVGGG